TIGAPAHLGPATFKQKTRQQAETT
ncbi:MAG: hypothetical protein JWR37_4587, partial [Mycobacterium sp.]|nr:hypothetical protein [Mycobacterium sp.]